MHGTPIATLVVQTFAVCTLSSTVCVYFRTRSHFLTVRLPISWPENRPNVNVSIYLSFLLFILHACPNSQCPRSPSAISRSLSRPVSLSSLIHSLPSHRIQKRYLFLFWFACHVPGQEVCQSLLLWVCLALLVSLPVSGLLMRNQCVSFHVAFNASPSVLCV